jgi:hypothetical protein
MKPSRYLQGEGTAGRSGNVRFLTPGATAPKSGPREHSARSSQHNVSECFRNVSNPRFRRRRDRQA